MSAKMNVNSLYNLIKKHCEADDFQIRISEFESLETRFAQNRITQHIAGKNTDVSIQVAVGEKWGSARTNQIDEENILKTLHKAHCIALLNETDPEFQPSEPASKYIEYTNYYGSTQKLKVQDHIEIISQCIDNAVKKDATISGMTEHHLIERHLMTQNGFIGHNQESRFEHSMTMKKDDRETKVSRSVLDFTDFDLNYEIKQINEQFDSLTSPVVMEPGKYNVILRPNAVVELFMFMLYSFDLRDADDRMTPYTGQIGKEMFGKLFSLTSDTKIKGLLTPGYSNDGIPTEETTWIMNGILRNMPTSRYYARMKKMKKVPDIFNIHIHGGDTSEKDMMKMVKNGIIINRFWYIREIDRKRGELTGMTRDGVLFFENGKIKNAVNNFRFNEIPYDVTKRIITLGQSVLQNCETKIPTMLIKDFNFVDKTSF